MGRDVRSHVYPRQQFLSVGDDAVIHCNAFGKVKWLFNNGALPPNSFYEVGHGKSSHTLTIKSVRTDNSGIYSCQGDHLRRNFQEDVQLIVSRNNYMVLNFHIVLARLQ